MSSSYGASQDSKKINKINKKKQASWRLFENDWLYICVEKALSLASQEKEEKAGRQKKRIPPWTSIFIPEKSKKKNPNWGLFFPDFRPIFAGDENEIVCGGGISAEGVADVYLLGFCLSLSLFFSSSHRQEY